MLGLLEQTSRDEIVVSLDAAVQGLLRDRYRKERDLARLVGEARRRLHIPDSPAACYRRVVELAYAIDGSDFDPLLPFLEACDEMWPYSETAGSYDPASPAALQSTQELLLLAVAEGSMHEYFQCHPEVEDWVGSMARRILSALGDGVRAERQSEAPVLLGTAVVLHDLLGGLAPYFQRVQDRARKEYSFVAHVIADIRRALLWSVLRDARPVVPTAPGAEAGFLPPPVKRFALPARSEFRYVRVFLERLAGDQEELEEVAAALSGLDLLPALAAVLRDCPFIDPAERQLGTEAKVLPFGQVALLQAYGQRAERFLHYTVDGVVHQTHLAHSWPDPAQAADMEMASLLPAGVSFCWKGVLGCRLDDRGKVYFGRVDRLAPAPEEEAYREAAGIVRRVDAACHQTVLQEWENYPDLFARLDSAGPLVFVRQPTATLLLCRAQALREVQALRNWTPQAEDETRALLHAVGMEVPEPWASFVLRRQGVPAPEPRGADPRKVWRAKIRKQMERERIPNFRRLVEKLAPFGVHETNRGKGSHGTLRLDGKEERNQTTWYALRHKAEPLPMPFVWECLERLGIGYQDFYQSLGGE